MKYRLGLDLGVASIGSAIIELDDENNPKQIIDTGVRIFEVSEGAADRRAKRTARKNYKHTQKRLALLAQLLFENGLWPTKTSDGTPEARANSPYRLRFHALQENLINPYHIGRIILHLAKHRGAGFVSIAEEQAEEILEEGDNQKKKKKKTSYELMFDYLTQTNSQTLGEYFYKRLTEDKIIRQRKFATEKGIVDYALPRWLVKDEFNKIWDAQAQYFPQMQKEGLKKQVYDILFYEKSPAPYATGKCIYFENEDRMLKAHPLSEMRRIYEQVNNIRLQMLKDNLKLTLEQRDKIVNNILLKGKNAGEKAIRKELNLTRQVAVILPNEGNTPLAAYVYATPLFQENEVFKNLSQDKLEELVDFLANPVKDPNDPNSRLFNEDEIIQKISERLNISSEKTAAQILNKIPKGRSMLGPSATKIILEKLKAEVISHREVTKNLTENDPRFTAEEERIRQMQGSCTELPYYGSILRTDTQVIPPLTILHNQDKLNADEIKYGRIANPGVHMILNQLRKVVNEIIKLYGKPYEINIELGRDVGESTKKKEDSAKQRRNNAKRNDEAKKYLIAHNMPISGENILKWKLADEQGWQDAYNPSNPIGQNFTGFEIEHIIPKEKGGTDTYMNLCLVSSIENAPKGNRFAYDYFAATKTPEQIAQILKFARTHLPPKKAWRFEDTAKTKYEDEGDKDETNRYLTDTRYVSKLAARYLRVIIDCKEYKDYKDADEKKVPNRILAVKGSQTAELRNQWGLRALEYDLMGLNVPEFSPYWINKKTGEVIEDKEKSSDLSTDWIKCEWEEKPRIDHRHHAMDAITIACMNRSLIQQMAQQDKLNELVAPLPMTTITSPAHFRQTVFEALKRIKVSHKPDHTPDGEFHEETAKVVICKNPNVKDALITVYVRDILQAVTSFKDFNKLLVPDSIKDEWNPRIPIDRAKQAKLKEDLENHCELAKAQLDAENEAAVADGGKAIEVSETRIIQRALRIIQDKKLYKNNSFRCYESNKSLVFIKKRNLAYIGGNNHCIDFFTKNGKVGWEVISRFNANQRDFIPQWKKDGAKPIWSIQQRDILELDTPEEWHTYTDQPRCLARVKKFSAGMLSIDYITDARMTSPKNKMLEYMFVDTLNNRGLSYLLSHHTRKVELTPFGKVKRKHKVLSDGSKTAT